MLYADREEEWEAVPTDTAIPTVCIKDYRWYMWTSRQWAQCVAWEVTVPCENNYSANILDRILICGTVL
jgi:hypothetical protein